MKDRAFVGTEVKYLVQIEAAGFDMTTDDFTITIRRGQKERTFQKSELVEETDAQMNKHYYICFDTAEFGPGVLTCIIRAYVPDTDFPDGIRTEVKKFPFINVEAV